VLGGDRATITFTNASGTQVRDWLAEVRQAARVRPIEANLTRGPQGYSGTVIVQMPGGSG
jgi:general secretion pathway protein M